MPLTEPLRLRLSAALTAHNTQRLPLFRKLHSYYRNPLTLSPSRHKWYSLSQQDSLPPRINPATSPRRDSVSGQLLGEYTLEFRNELAHGMIKGLSIT